MTNIEIVDLLRAVAASYKIKDQTKNRFRIIAYERAADAIEHLSSEAKDLWDDNKLSEVGGIGESIAGHLGDIFETGKSSHFATVLEGIPPSIFELLKISGIGPKTAFKLVNQFEISDEHPYEDFVKLAKEGKLNQIPGFGKKSIDSLIKSVTEVEGREVRLLLPYAQEIAEEIINWIQKDKWVQRADALGSVRRKVSTVGDIDIAASSDNPQKTLEHFTKYPKVSRVLEKGDRSASIIIPGQRQVDLMVENPDAYGALLQHFTGSKHHNIALRKYAQKRNLSLSDYGFKPLAGFKTLKENARFFNKTLGTYQFANEDDLYRFIGLEPIPPELREDRGEIQMAEDKSLPCLVVLDDIKADLHMHSNFNIETSHDLGLSTMEDMLEIADSLNYEYLAFTEHNPSKSKHDTNSIYSLLKEKKRIVEEINYSLKNSTKHRVKKVFNSLEVDMLPEGGLSIDDKAMDVLDFALCSIHSSFNLDRKRMTRRVINSLMHPKAKIFAHPTGRKLNEREGVELDWEEIFAFCKTNNKWLEINASPSRLDLPDMLVQEALKHKIKLTIGTDSHHKDSMLTMKYGVYVARRGHAQSKDIVNTYSLSDFESML
ncbi:hypothetical protein IPM62_03920 [Candidatus Woesebacteria bacterium]|nr:MAG: hypothetical protein IPM62_03920 [Candidatus Woesebacteria bacterium]